MGRFFSPAQRACSRRFYRGDRCWKALPKGYECFKLRILVVSTAAPPNYVGTHRGALYKKTKHCYFKASSRHLFVRIAMTRPTPTPFLKTYSTREPTPTQSIHTTRNTRENNTKCTSLYAKGHLAQLGMFWRTHHAKPDENRLG
jgi:hypothetical protein